MKTLSKLLAFIPAFLLLFACNKVDTEGGNYDVVTSDADVTVNAVTLHGKVANSIDMGTVTEVGFLVSEKDKFSDGDARKITAPLPEEGREFTLKLTMEDLGNKRDVLFYYKAYVVTDGTLSSGRQKGFRTQAIEVTAFSLSQTGAGLKRNETLQLKAIITPPDATYQTVTWSSSDEKVATVSQSGLVKAVGKGKVTITAKLGKFSAECNLGILGDKPAGAVDMGLSVYWAPKPIMSGHNYAYISWGETADKDFYAAGTYKYYNNGYTKYNSSDKLTTLQPEDDAATANLGKAWRTPTPEEWRELAENTTRSNGYNFKSKITGEMVEVKWCGFKVNAVIKGSDEIGIYMTNELPSDNYYNQPLLFSYRFDTAKTDVSTLSAYGYALTRDIGFAVIGVSEGE